MAQRVHISFPIIIHTPHGRLKFREAIRYNAKADVAGPDPFPGHISHVHTVSPPLPPPPPPLDSRGTIMLPPKPRDELQDIIEHRAEAPAATFDSGQTGRLVKDFNTDPVPIVESPTSSDSTAGIWRKGKVFAGKIKF